MHRPGHRLPALHLAFLIVAVAVSAGCSDRRSWIGEIEQVRQEREERLRSDDGWLTLVGLHWLSPGENAFGSSEELPIVLDAPGVPARAGVLIYDGESVYLNADPDADVRIDGEKVTERALRDDRADETDVVEVGRLRFHVIHRGDRHGIRVKDPGSALRMGFDGLDYFPIRPEFRFRAAFRPYDEPRDVAISTVIGSSVEMRAPGRVEFSIDGESQSLEAYADDAEAAKLWLIFKDGTSGKETYGAGRYLVAKKDGDRVDLDFNLAYNPPCAFTAYATCPLPPPGNRLAARIEAGERDFGAH